MLMVDRIRGSYHLLSLRLHRHGLRLFTTTLNLIRTPTATTTFFLLLTIIVLVILIEQAMSTNRARSSSKCRPSS